MTRRTFVSAAAAAAGVSKLPVTGAGAYQFEVMHDWGELPKSIRYGNTHGVAVDASGHVYVHHTVHATSESEDTMVVFDGKGRFVRSWGREFKGGAHGLRLRKEGREEFLYFCDTKRALVAKYTLKGERVWEVGYPEEAEQYKPGADGKRQKYSPTNLAVAANGDVYVGDGYGSSYVNVYDAAGKWKFTFGGKGKGAGEMDCPHGIMIEGRGGEERVVVADRGNRRFQTFTMDGRHVGFGGVGDVKMPCHFDERKGLVVVPDLEARVTLLGAGQKVVAQLGEDASGDWGAMRKKAREEFRAGQFICPHGACFDHDGNIFVVEWVEVGRVTKLRRLA